MADYIHNAARSLGKRREQHFPSEPPRSGKGALRAGAGVASQGRGAAAAEQGHPFRAFHRSTGQLTATFHMRNVPAARHMRHSIALVDNDCVFWRIYLLEDSEDITHLHNAYFYSVRFFSFLFIIVKAKLHNYFSMTKFCSSQKVYNK